MLIILGGLPGSGKTTIARALARKIGAVHLRVDTIEVSIKESSPKGIEVVDAGAGYFVAYEIAKDNLSVGNIVIADSVNPISLTRESWRNIATITGNKFIEIEIVCSDKVKHKQRVEARKADIKNHILPTWQKVQDRQYDEWEYNGISIDTSIYDIDRCVKQIEDFIYKDGL